MKFDFKKKIYNLKKFSEPLINYFFSPNLIIKFQKTKKSNKFQNKTKIFPNKSKKSLKPYDV